jgi:Domain of unknown function (DUF4331)
MLECAMSRLTDFAVIGLAGLVAAGASALLVRDSVSAADHLDPPGRTDIRVDPTIDLPGDIADIYTWTTPTHLNMVLTFAGPVPGARGGFYDPNVRYRFHISNAGRTDDDEFTVMAQFGPGQGGNGIKVDGLPGVTGSVIGPVERILTAPNGVRVFAGVRSDPFFFDVLGFRETNSTGTLSIRNTRDFFFNQNDTTIAVQVPIALVGTDSNGDGRVDNRMDIWVDSFRKGGQL